MNRVTSRFMVSPFLRGLIFGIPWQQTSLTLVQTLLGKPMNPRAVGNALFLIMNSWQILSNSSVVMPSFTWEAKLARVLPANLAAILSPFYDKMESERELFFGRITLNNFLLNFLKLDITSIIKLREKKIRKFLEKFLDFVKFRKGKKRKF